MQRVQLKMGWTEVCLLALFFAAAAALAAAQEIPREDLTTSFNRAQKLQSSGDMVGAETLLTAGLQDARASRQFDWVVRFMDTLASLRALKADLNGARALYLEELDIKKSRQLGSLSPVMVSIALMSARLNHYRESLKEAEAAAEVARGEDDKRTLANALNIKGQVLRQLGRMSEAEQPFNEAVSLFEAFDPHAALRVRVNLADLYWRRSEFRKALLTAFSVLDPLQKSDSLRDLAAAYDALGNTFKLLQQDDRALEYFGKALEIREKLPDRINRAFSYNNVATALTSLGRPNEACTYHLKALEIRRAAQSQREIAQSLINLAIAENAAGRRTDALQHYTEAAELCEKNRYTADLATVLFDIAEMLMTSVQWRQAEDMLNRALALRRETSHRLGVVRCLSDLALVREHLNEEAADADYRAAMAAYEKLAAEVADPEQLGTFQQAALGVYPRYTRHLIEKRRVTEALQIAERGRAIGLSMLAAMNAVGWASAPETDRQAWRQAEIRYSRASNRLRVAGDQAAAQPAESARSLDEARAEYIEAQRALAEIRDRTFLATQGRAAPLRRIDSGFLRQLASANPDTLFLEFLVAENDQVFLFSIADDGVRVFPLSVKQLALKEKIGEWRQLLGSSASRGVNLIPKLGSPAVEQRVAGELYELILGPVESMLQRHGVRRLVVIRDGPLLEAPLSALMDHDGRRLIEHLALRSEVSLARCAVEAATPKTGSGVLIVADPLNLGETRRVAQNTGIFTPLIYARKEGREIAALDQETTLLSGDSAREGTVKSAMAAARVLHFATHAYLSGSLHSGLLLATEPLSSVEDGVLEAREIAETPMRAQLAVLSACDTLRGEFQPGEGLIGLAWAFQAAGVRTVTASLWAVNDAATAKLMVEFYGALHRGLPVDEALRSAMLEMARDPKWYHPYYWAPFAVFGASEPVW